MTRFVDIEGELINPDQITRIIDNSIYSEEWPTKVALSDGIVMATPLTRFELLALIDPPVVPYHQTPVGWDDSPEPGAPAADPNQPALDFSAVPVEVVLPSLPTRAELTAMSREELGATLGEPSLAEAWRARKGRK